MVFLFTSLSVPALLSPRSRPGASFLPLLGVRVPKKIWLLILDLANAHDKRYYGRLSQAKKGE
jgi:hypothetical protein